MKILITGCSGQLGRTILNNIKKIDFLDLEIYSPSKSELDLRDIDFCREYTKKISPNFIINCAAFTDVDKTEDESTTANLINSYAPEAFASVIRENNGHIIHISSDYVFDGKSTTAYKPFQERIPLNAYGKSKLLGEQAVENLLTASNQFSIIRTSWLISPFGGNFISKIIKKLNSNNSEIKVVFDQIGCTTSVFSLSELVFKIIKLKCLNKKLSSHFHFCDIGVTSWYDVAIAIKEISLDIGLIKHDKEIIPIKSNELKTNCKRPAFSLLDSTNTYKELDITPKYWKSELKKILNLIKHHENF